MESPSKLLQKKEKKQKNFIKKIDKEIIKNDLKKKRLPKTYQQALDYLEIFNTIPFDKIGAFENKNSPCNYF